ncbi:hypothetical protein [Hymenobacter swuensis]|uniref:Uncharacterized protein n=1 Tax=Hymenobacter swuensis DY53 TaxID=1227739 RepID=W8F3A2_9BACT|nr:hypothetical protein [Hymenobacter swuensis]AHJ96285.1 hypothetical protein Hsw_0690 [Hymenobacter swuensis DY53]
MINFRLILISILVMFFGMILWMGYYFYFRTDGRGNVTREADSPEAAVRGQQTLQRADALINQRQYTPAKALLDSLRDADANPAFFISTEDLEQRFNTLRARRRRDQAAQ